MSEKNLLIAVVRIGAILILVQLLNYVPLTLGTTEYPEFSFYLYATTYSPAIITFIFAVLIWIFPQMLLTKIRLGKIEKIENADRFIVGIFAIVGVFIVVYGID